MKSLAHPGGNLTGFTVLEESIGAKLLKLLKEIVPTAARIAVMINPDSPKHLRLFNSAADAAKRFEVEVVRTPVRDVADIEAAMTQLGRNPAQGLIVPPDPSTNTHRKLIVELAARYRVPTIYALRATIIEGGLISYGVDIPDLFRQAAIYVDRVLRAKSRLTCQCKRRPSTKLCSTSRPPKRSASPCRRLCSPAPTR